MTAISTIIPAILHAVFLAFGLIMPLGAQNIFIFNQGAAAPTFRYFLPSILTAAICDTILILLAVLGVSMLVLELLWLKLIIFVFGFIFLIFMGLSIWRQNTSNLQGSTLKAMSPKKQIIFAASVSLLNPHAVIDTIAVIGTSAVTYAGYEKLAYTLTCIIVSWIWFFLLAVAGRKVRKLNRSGSIIKYLNKIAAIIMWTVAGYLAHEIIQLLVR